MKRIGLVLLFLCILAIAVTYAVALLSGSAPRWSAWIVAIATCVAMMATMSLGAARAGKSMGGLGRLAVPFLVTLVIIVGAFVLALTLPAEGEPIVLGLPRRAAAILYGVGLLPVFVLPLAYALTFEEMTLDDEDLERVRRAARERQEAQGEEQRQ